MHYFLSRSTFVLLFKILFRIKVQGSENIPRRGGFILASNHLSYLDPIALGVACYRRLDFMARHDLFSNPLFGKALLNVGAFAVKRNSADASALKEAIRRLRRGSGLVVFPEGSRGFEGRRFDPQAGIGFLAAKTKVPVIPAYIKGTDKALPKGAKFIRLHRISVSFGREIPIGHKKDYQDIAKEIMAEICRLGENS